MRRRYHAFRFARALGARQNVPLSRIGDRYGGWWVPDGLLSGTSIVYSAGVGEDVTFGLGLIRQFGCDVWAFDPTPRAISFAKAIEESRFHFLPVGIWSTDATLRFYAPGQAAHVSHSVANLHSSSSYFEAHCLSLKSVMARLGHDHIDLLKLDIEGAEYDVLASLEVVPRAICVEFHPTRSRRETTEFVKSLDYAVVKIEGWNVTLIPDHGLE